MKLRIGIWAAVGALVVICWGLYLSATFPAPFVGTAGMLIDLTCPIALVRHHAMNFDSVLVVNTGTYALVGAIVEMMRLHRKASRSLRTHHAN